MFLEQKFYELNAVALEVGNAIHGIQLGYLSGNKDYPYSEIDILMNSYLILFNKFNKKKNSKINKMINSIVSKKDLYFNEIILIDEKKVLMMASQKTLFYILQNMEQYIPYDEESTLNISKKLFPIIKDLDMDTIALVYHKLKNYVQSNNDVNKNENLLYLQHLFMGYVMYKTRIHNMDKDISKMSYEEVCRYVLEEDVLDSSKEVVKKRMVI